VYRTGLGSYWALLAVKLSNHGNYDYEVLELNDFKDLLHQIPKLSRPYSVFKDFQVLER